MHTKNFFILTGVQFIWRHLFYYAKQNDIEFHIPGRSQFYSMMYVCSGDKNWLFVVKKLIQELI